MSENRKRAVEVRARVTPEERGVIQTAAAAAGLEVPDYIRSVLLGAKAPRRHSMQRAKAMVGVLEKLVEIHKAVCSLELSAHTKPVVPLSVIARVIEELREVRSAVVTVHRSSNAENDD